MEKEIKEYIISSESLQKLLNYLASRPYQEVFQLVALIHQAQPKAEEKDKKELKVVEKKG